MQKQSSAFAQEKTVQGILDTNSFEKGLGSADRVLCPTLARFNHSCVPNCTSAAVKQDDMTTHDNASQGITTQSHLKGQHVWDSDAEVMRILASTEISVGSALRLCRCCRDLHGWSQWSQKGLGSGDELSIDYIDIRQSRQERQALLSAVLRRLALRHEGVWLPLLRSQVRLPVYLPGVSARR